MTKAKTCAANTAETAPAGTKKDFVLALMRRDCGASLDEIVKESGWQPHSARAVLTGFRKAGIAVEKKKVDGSTRYTAAAEPVA